MTSMSTIQRGDRGKTKEFARLEILTVMLIKNFVFRNMNSCRDAAQIRDKCKPEWMPGSLKGRIFSEPLTAFQKGTVRPGDSWKSRLIVAVFLESCTELCCHLGCDAVYSCKYKSMFRRNIMF